VRGLVATALFETVRQWTDLPRDGADDGVMNGNDATLLAIGAVAAVLLAVQVFGGDRVPTDGMMSEWT
jgi:hypothetical protein